MLIPGTKIRGLPGFLNFRNDSANERTTSFKHKNAGLFLQACVLVLSKSVSRVLYWMTIFLGCLLPVQLQPPCRKHAEQALSVFCAVLHRVGFTWPHGLPCAGELLPRLSILTAGKSRRRYLSVALALKSPSAAVSRCPALWCSDFPQMPAFRRRHPLPSGLLRKKAKTPYPLLPTA